MYVIRIEEKAHKNLLKIPNPYRRKINQLILNLSTNPKPRGCKKLKSTEYYRIRISNYRIIYQIKNKELIILIIEIGQRKDIYRMLK
jgi:mRNA interferase RelE/StbE